jgi:hypothetical protein
MRWSPTETQSPSKHGAQTVLPEKVALLVARERKQVTLEAAPIMACEVVVFLLPALPEFPYPRDFFFFLFFLFFSFLIYKKR